MLLSIDWFQLNAGVSSLKLDESESIANQERSDTSVGQTTISFGFIRILFQFDIEGFFVR